MNKVYIIFPLLGLAVFTGFYLNFSKGYKAHQAEIEAKADIEKKAKAAAQVKAREQAIQDAVEASKRRAIERVAKEKADEDKKTARQEAEDRRQRTYDDRNKLRDQVSRLKKDLDEVKAVVTKTADEKKHAQDEDVFLKTYVKQAEANVKYYYDLLDKIDAAEKAKADAAAAAAAAAKQKS